MQSKLGQKTVTCNLSTILIIVVVVVTVSSLSDIVVNVGSMGRTELLLLSFLVLRVLSARRTSAQYGY